MKREVRLYPRTLGKSQATRLVVEEFRRRGWSVTEICPGAWAIDGGDLDSDDPEPRPGSESSATTEEGR